MTKDQLREAIDIFVQNYGTINRTGTLTANELLAWASGYGMFISFCEGYEVVMEVIKDYDLKWRN